MIGLHANQKKILECLLEHPDGSTLEELAGFLGLSKSAAKEHVLKLEALGLLTYRDIAGLIGRPKRRYHLTPSGHEAFPRQYSWLSSILLAFLARKMGPPEVAKMMEVIAVQVAEGMGERFRRQRTNPALFGEISKAMNELGYRTTVKQSDLRKGAVLEATNCVYHSVAKAHPELCRFDTKFLEQATGGMSVRLESCIARGGEVCRFCVRSGGKDSR